MYQRAAILTVRIGFIGIAAAIVIGLFCIIIQYYKIPVLRRLVSIYIEISRNTSVLVQLFFIYCGLPKIGIQTDADVCGAAGLAFLGGSYMCEAFRSGIGVHPADSGRKRREPRYEPPSDLPVRDFVPGLLRQHSTAAV